MRLLYYPSWHSSHRTCKVRIELPGKLQARNHIMLQSVPVCCPTAMPFQVARLTVVAQSWASTGMHTHGSSCIVMVVSEVLADI